MPSDNLLEESQQDRSYSYDNIVNSLSYGCFSHIYHLLQNNTGSDKKMSITYENASAGDYGAHEGQQSCW